MKLLSLALSAVLTLGIAAPATAQFNWGRAISGAFKAVQAATITDKQMAAYVKGSIEQMDRQNTVLPPSDPYSIRLDSLTSNITEADGIPLNFKVYKTKDVNAFACPDGSVRVFSALMDIMNDDELLGVIGHEIGHVLKHHSKKAFQNQLLRGALRDEIASTGGVAAALTDSQLGALGESFASAKYSRKQETEADNCGYDFLVKNGKNPWGMAMAFEKLQQLESGGRSVSSSYLQKMFSSHPDTQSRIKNIVKRCKKDGYAMPDTVQPAAVSIALPAKKN